MTPLEILPIDYCQGKIRESFQIYTFPLLGTGCVVPLYPHRGQDDDLPALGCGVGAQDEQADQEIEFEQDRLRDRRHRALSVWGWRALPHL